MLVLNTPDKTKVLTLETSRPFPVVVALPADAINVPYAIANIAALRAAPTPAIADVIRGVLGYYTAGDVDMPIYRWSPTSTAADNGGSVIRPTAILAANPGRWIAVLKGDINVKWFGAKGDGTTDDSAAIQAAVTAGANLTIFFPEGIYAIGTRITIPHAHFHLMGAAKFSASFKPLAALSAATAMFEITAGYGFKISGLGFDGNNLARTAIKITGYHGDISDLLFFGNWGCWIHNLAAWDTHYRTIDGTNDTTNRGGIGILFEYSVNCTISQCKLGHLSRCVETRPTYHPTLNYRCEGIMISDSILIDSRDAVFADGITHISIVGCTLDLLINSAVQLYGGFSATIADCWLAGVAANWTGVLAQNTFSKTKIIGCHFENGNGSAGQQAMVMNGDHFRIVANTFEMPGGIGYGNTGYVAGNRFENGGISLLGTADTYNVVCNEGITESLIRDYLTMVGANDPRISLKNATRKWNLELNGNTARFVDVTQNRNRVEFVGGATGGMSIAGPVAINKAAGIAAFAVSGLNQFADNAAAISGGLTAGDVYHTGGTLKVVI